MDFGMPTLIELPEIPDCAALCRQLGLQFVELNMNLPQYQVNALDEEQLLRTAKRENIYYTVHLDETLDPCNFNPRVAEAWTKTVLETIGRRHTAMDFLRAWDISKEYSFQRNVDLIAGLPADTPDSFCKTLDRIVALRPENITVHTLTVKHASTLKEEGPRRRTALEMVEYSRSALYGAGYRPYYLYRQKGTVDALENVGYALPQNACKYNVYIMDDGHTIDQQNDIRSKFIIPISVCQFCYNMVSVAGTVFKINQTDTVDSVEQDIVKRLAKIFV